MAMNGWNKQKIMERPRYYPRQLVTHGDMTLEQEYFRQKMRRHNWMLHGWGVVCGAEVCRLPSESKEETPDPWMIQVKPGYLLDPYGEEIYIDAPHQLDLRRFMPSTADPSGHTSDPWCSKVEKVEGVVYLAVKYIAKETHRVPAPPSGCDSSQQCEYSRWLDCYEFGLLDACPPSHQSPPSLEKVGRGPIPACPPEPTDPWVVLARLELTDAGIVDFDVCGCRRQVVGFGHFWWQCQTGREEHAAHLDKEEITARLRVLLLDSALNEIREPAEAAATAAAMISNTPKPVRQALGDMSIADVAGMEHKALVKRLELTEADAPAVKELQARARMVMETVERVKRDA